MKVNSAKLDIERTSSLRRALALAIPVALLAALAAGCGGGGGGGGGSASTLPTGTTITVEGEVTDSFFGTAIPNAVIKLKGYSVSTTANSSGDFTINDIPASTDVVFVVTDPANSVTQDIDLTTSNTSPQTGVDLSGEFLLQGPP